MPLLETYTDEVLYQLSKEGNFDAFNELYKRYWKVLFAMARKKLNDLHDAEEIVQDVFVDLWNQREKTVITLSLKSYLAGMVKFKVYSRLALYYKRQQNTASLTTDDTSLSTEFSADELFRLKELKEEIANAVNSLPERCRLIYTLSREEGLTHKQIASDLNISEKTIETQITRALRRIRVALQSFVFFL
jgi:RNA polymerase sigma-70 factor (ECF subfamily)